MWRFVAIPIALALIGGCARSSPGTGEEGNEAQAETPTPTAEFDATTGQAPRASSAPPPDSMADAAGGSDDDAAVHIELEGPTTALVVFDKSGSMTAGWGDQTKWAAAGEALVGAIEPVQDRLTLGAIFFPQGGDCTVPGLEAPTQMAFVSGSEFLARWSDVFSLNPAEGATPMVSALREADRAIRIAQDRGVAHERFSVIVLTDGEPNCDEDFAILEQLPAQWLEEGIRTHVIGLPGSEPAADLLDAIAKAGGTEKHQSPGDPGELAHDIAAAL